MADCFLAMCTFWHLKRNKIRPIKKYRKIVATLCASKLSKLMLMSMLDFYTSFEYQHDELLKYIQKASELMHD